jgi:hypothetical protein
MTTDFVIAYVRRKMKEEGHGDKYLLAFREIKLRAKESIVIKAIGQYYYFVAGFTTDITIVSDTGVYDQVTDKTNEIQHEHTGKITITNKLNPILHLQFIVVTPKKNIKR